MVLGRHIERGHKNSKEFNAVYKDMGFLYWQNQSIILTKLDKQSANRLFLGFFISSSK